MTARDGALRIACVAACPYPVPQGSQVYLRETALGIHRRGHDVRLVVYGYGRGHDESGLPIHRSRNIPGARRTRAGPALAKPVLDGLLVRRLRRVIRRHDVQIVDAHNYEGLLAAVAAGKRPIIYHAHNVMSDELPSYARDPGVARRFGRWLDETLPKRADQIVTPHQPLAEYLAACGCAADRITVIPPPAAPTLPAPDRIESDNPPVLYAGNLDSYQNIGLLLETMQVVRSARPGTTLRVATSDAQDVAGAEMVRIDGLLALQRELRQDAVFACPRTSWSGYPIKVLNAMAAGLPVVCCEGSAHAITHGLDGLVVPDNDPAAFAGALVKLLDSAELRGSLGRNARATIETRHNPKTCAVLLEDVYRAALDMYEG